jgi:G-patch domain
MSDGLAFELGGPTGRGRGRKRRRVASASVDEPSPAAATETAFANGGNGAPERLDDTERPDGEEDLPAVVSTRVDVITADAPAADKLPGGAAAPGDGASEKEQSSAPVSQIARLIERRRQKLSAGALEEDELYQLDVAQCADATTADDYSRVPIESFGAALLKRMGWDGKPDGKSEALANAPVSRLLGGEVQAVDAPPGPAAGAPNKRPRGGFASRVDRGSDSDAAGDAGDAEARRCDSPADAPGRRREDERSAANRGGRSDDDRWRRGDNERGCRSSKDGGDRRLPVWYDGEQQRERIRHGGNGDGQDTDRHRDGDREQRRHSRGWSGRERYGGRWGERDERDERYERDERDERYCDYERDGGGHSRRREERFGDSARRTEAGRVRRDGSHSRRDREDACLGRD